MLRVDGPAKSLVLQALGGCADGFRHFLAPSPHRGRGLGRGSSTWTRPWPTVGNGPRLVSSLSVLPQPPLPNPLPRGERGPDARFAREKQAERSRCRNPLAHPSDDSQDRTCNNRGRSATIAGSMIPSPHPPGVSPDGQDQLSASKPEAQVSETTPGQQTAPPGVEGEPQAANDFLIVEPRFAGFLKEELERKTTIEKIQVPSRRLIRSSGIARISAVNPFACRAYNAKSVPTDL
jgi:hypothetical protein